VGETVAEAAAGRLARCPRCQTIFGICRVCDRGHVYCGPACSGVARRDSLRRARLRHRHSPEGRLDHRDRERARRRRRRETLRVGDHPSAAAVLSFNLPAFSEEARPNAPISTPAPLRVGRPRRCAVCRGRLRFTKPERLRERGIAPARASPPG